MLSDFRYHAVVGGDKPERGGFFCQVGVGRAAVVRKVGQNVFRIIAHDSERFHAVAFGSVVERAHVSVFADAGVAVGTVERNKVDLLAAFGKKGVYGIGQYPAVVELQVSLTVLLDKVYKAVFAFHVRGGERRDFVIARCESLVRLDRMYFQRLFSFRAQFGRNKAAYKLRDRFVPEYFERGRNGIVSVRRAAVNELERVAVIGVRVREKHVFHSRKIDAAFEFVRVRVGRKVHEQIVVYKDLTARTDIFAAEPTGKSAKLAVAKYRGNAFRGGSPQKFDRHAQFTAFFGVVNPIITYIYPSSQPLPVKIA